MLWVVITAPPTADSCLWSVGHYGMDVSLARLKESSADWRRRERIDGFVVHVVAARDTDLICSDFAAVVVDCIYD
jgi:hypothetical protein